MQRFNAATDGRNAIARPADQIPPQLCGPLGELPSQHREETVIFACAGKRMLPSEAIVNEGTSSVDRLLQNHWINEVVGLHAAESEQSVGPRISRFGTNSWKAFSCETPACCR